jgi:hypothetical protein
LLALFLVWTVVTALSIAPLAMAKGVLAQSGDGGSSKDGVRRSWLDGEVEDRPAVPNDRTARPSGTMD